MILFGKIIHFLLAGLISWSATTCTSNEVKIKGRQILVDGSPYLIRGICYNPVPVKSDTRDFSNLTTDLELMTEAGINTMRVYAPIDDVKVLDEIRDAGMRIIVGFGYNQGGHYDIVSGTYLDYIKQYKDHDAILMWELGNEYNYHPEWFQGDLKNWYAVLNAAAMRIHEEDPSHPVTTAHGELPDQLALSFCPDIDVWGMNVYRWDAPKEIFAQWSALSAKPMYLSEAGADSYMTIARDGYEQGVNEKVQADANARILQSVFDHGEICSGVTLFSFSDEWWKAGNNDVQDVGGWAPNSTGVPYDGTPNEEFWGIVDIHRNKKQSYAIVKKIYTGMQEELE